eukprot:COSAG06_NODE_156_length_21863_cov_29.245405_5_plen_163_part_00
MRFEGRQGPRLAQQLLDDGRHTWVLEVLLEGRIGVVGVVVAGVDGVPRAWHAVGDPGHGSRGPRHPVLWPLDHVEAAVRPPPHPVRAGRPMPLAPRVDVAQGLPEGGDGVEQLGAVGGADDVLDHDVAFNLQLPALGRRQPLRRHLRSARVGLRARRKEIAF